MFFTRYEENLYRQIPKNKNKLTSNYEKMYDVS